METRRRSDPAEPWSCQHCASTRYANTDTTSWLSEFGWASGGLTTIWCSPVGAAPLDAANVRRVFRTVAVDADPQAAVAGARATSSTSQPIAFRSRASRLDHPRDRAQIPGRIPAEDAPFLGDLVRPAAAQLRSRLRRAQSLSRGAMPGDHLRQRYRLQIPHRAHRVAALLSRLWRRTRYQLSERTTTTGQVAWCTECWLTEPNKAPMNPPRPWLPTTSRSAPLACSISTAAG